MFHALLNNPINKKTDPPKKAVKDREGGVEGRYDRGQRFTGFFCEGFPYLNQKNHFQFQLIANKSENHVDMQI